MSESKTSKTCMKCQWSYLKGEEGMLVVRCTLDGALATKTCEHFALFVPPKENLEFDNG